jgi:hypothetical protein
MQKSNEALTMDSIRLMTLLSGRIQSSLSKSTKDIQQVMSLLDQTIDQLIQHFLSINMDLQQLKNQVPEQGATSALSHCENAIQSIVTDLQFHDIANQLLNRVQGRFSSLQNMLSAIAADSALMTTSTDQINFTDLTAYLECIERLIADTQSQSQNPVAETIRQTPMSGGEIELF